MSDSTATLMVLIVATAYVGALAATAVFVWYASTLSRVFARRGVEPWRAWVPVLNEAEILRLGGRPAWNVVFLFIPVLCVYGLILRVLAAHRIGREAGRGAGTTVLAVLLPPVWSTVVAVSREDAGEGAAPVAVAAAVRAPSPVVAAPVNPVAMPVPVEPPAPVSMPMPAAPPVLAPVELPEPIAAPAFVAPSAPVDEFVPAAAPVALEPPASVLPPAPEQDELPAHPPAPTIPPAPVEPVPAELVAHPPAPAIPSAPVESELPAPMVPSTPSEPELSAPSVLPTPPESDLPAPPTPEPYLSAPTALPTPVESLPPAPTTPPAPVESLPPAPTFPPVAIAQPASFQPPEPIDPSEPSAPAASPATTTPASPAPDLSSTVVVPRPRSPWLLRVGDTAYPLTEPVVVLGRRPSGEEPGVQYLPVEDPSRTLSKQHACLTLADGVWSIADLDSTNGVFVERSGVEQRVAAGASEPVDGRLVLGRLGMTIEREDTP